MQVGAIQGRAFRLFVDRLVETGATRCPELINHNDLSGVARLVQDLLLVGMNNFRGEGGSAIFLLLDAASNGLCVCAFFHSRYGLSRMPASLACHDYRAL